MARKRRHVDPRIIKITYNDESPLEAIEKLDEDESEPTYDEPKFEVEEDEEESDVLEPIDPTSNIQKICVLVNNTVEHMYYAGCIASMNSDHIVDIAVYGDLDNIFLLSKTPFVNTVFSYSKFVTEGKSYEEYDRVLMIEDFSARVMDRKCKYETVCKNELDFTHPVFYFDITKVDSKLVMNSLIVIGSMDPVYAKKHNKDANAIQEEYKELAIHNDGQDIPVAVVSLDYENSYIPFITKRVSRINCDLNTAAIILKLSNSVLAHKHTDLYWLCLGLDVPTC